MKAIWKWSIVALLGACVLSCAKAPPLEQACATSEDCATRGLCSYDNATSLCRASSEKDCRESRFCLNLGECSYENGKCIAKVEKDCRNSTQCKDAKRCIPSGGVCVEINPGYCRINNPRCKTHGECTLDSKNNTCIAKDAKDCAASDLCKQIGLCSLDSDDKKCVVASNEDCQGSELCRKEGKCTVGGPLNDRLCEATKSKDCIQSERCQSEGFCALDSTKKICISGAEYCADVCKSLGKCTYDAQGLCRVATDDDCKQSELCKTQGRCKAIGEQCIRDDGNPCLASQLCRTHGACSYKDGVCKAISNSDCQLSARCWLYGLCRAELSSGRCVFDSCAEPCFRFGRCLEVTENGEKLCAVGSSDHCQNSLLCKHYGLCKQSGNLCVFAGDCKSACKVSGHCVQGSLTPYADLPERAACIAKTEQDCTQSDNCKRYGLCQLKANHCVLLSCSGPPCQLYGNCHESSFLNSTLCLPQETKDCANSQECSQRGLCSYDTNLRTCSASSDEDCVGPPCSGLGRCRRQWNPQERRWQCVVVDEVDCEKSEECRKSGLCVRDGDECKQVKDCKIPCQRYGLCSPVADSNPLLCRANSDSDCEKSEDCKSRGACKRSEDGSCSPLSDKDCEGSYACQLRGLCLFDPKLRACTLLGCVGKLACTIHGRCKEAEVRGSKQCVADKEDDCKQSKDCKEKGLCRLEKGACVLESCKGTPCGTYGRCSERNVSYLGEIVRLCTALTVQDCEQSQECKTQGACKPSSNRCIVSSDTDCQKSTKCTEHGHCKHQNGTCVIGSSLDCANSQACKRDGLCERKGGTCVATSFSHCQKSTKCLQSGLCRFENGACVTDALSCSGSYDCLLRGLCKYDESKKTCVDSGCGTRGTKGSTPCSIAGRCVKKEVNDPKTSQKVLLCVAETHADCKNSLDCQLRGLCEADANDPTLGCKLTSCKESPCKVYGRCTAKHVSYLGQQTSLCVSASKQDCLDSSRCKEYGECSLQTTSTGGVCFAATDADCANSLGCKTEGKCRAKGGLCIILTSKDCQSSDACKLEGRCESKKDNNVTRCVANSNLACQNSKHCTLFGRCVRNTQSEVCSAASSACKKDNSPCKVYGRCKLSSVQGGSSSATQYQECEADSDANCQRSEGCGKFGLCKKGAGNHCTASLDSKDCPTCGKCASCSTCSSCTDYGRCTREKEGDIHLCKVGNDATCAKSNGCLLYGLCKADLPTNACIAGSAAHCINSKNCTQRGECHFQGTSCVALSDADCKKGTLCEKEGLCQFDTIRKTCLIASNKDCETSKACTIEGRCRLKITLNGERSCVASTIAFCTNSQNCKDFGRCSKRGGIVCSATPVHCSSAEPACRIHGRCKEGKTIGTGDQAYTTCEVNSDANCSASEVCQLNGQCAADVFLNYCVVKSGVPCTKLPVCSRYGRCNNVNKSLLVFDRTTNRFVVKKVQVCNVNTDANCRKSTGCRERGECHVDITNDRCVPKLDSDCKNSTLCSKEGRCKVDVSLASCVK